MMAFYYKKIKFWFKKLNFCAKFHFIKKKLFEFMPFASAFSVVRV